MRSSTLFSELVCLLLVTSSRHSARASWRKQLEPTRGSGRTGGSTRSYKWYTLGDLSKRTLCEMNDRHRFQRFLQPLLVPRIVGTAEHQAVAWHLANTLSSLGFTVEWDRFGDSTPHGDKLFENLIATYDASAPRRLVLACHYDSKVLPGETFIGATDSAVPCAQLLDLASTLAPYLAARRNKDVTLQLVFFDGEEAFDFWSEKDSLYGARHLAKVWKEQFYPYTGESSFVIASEIDRIDLLILLDLIGAANPHFFNFANYSTTNAFMKMTEIENELRGFGCLHALPQAFIPRTLPVTHTVEDDHKPFQKHGVPVIHLISLPFPPFWHTSADNADVIDYDSIENINAVLRVFVAMFLGLVP